MTLTTLILFLVWTVAFLTWLTALRFNWRATMRLAGLASFLVGSVTLANIFWNTWNP